MITLLLIFLAGCAYGTMAVLQFHFSSSVFYKTEGTQSYFWYPDLSWMNKYKYRDKNCGEAFPGSTTLLVFLTDGFHLIQFFMLKFIFAAIIFYSPIIYGWSLLICKCSDFILLASSFGAGFVLFYNYLLIKKTKS